MHAGLATGNEDPHSRLHAVLSRLVHLFIAVQICISSGCLNQLGLCAASYLKHVIFLSEKF